MEASHVTYTLALVAGVLTLTAAQDFDRSICQQPAETGMCRAAIPMWQYNASTGQCSEFIWGGCPGSLNKFPTRETCIRNCNPEVCELPPDVGPCRANIRLWFYDNDHHGCREFSYGGCEGNDNKFPSLQSCETACAGTNLLCEFGRSFETIGYKSVHSNYREMESYTYSCERRCRSACLNDHPWGTCWSFSTRKRWYTCQCYLYDRFLSENEFDDDTSGTTRNRMCAQEGETEEDEE